MSCVSLPLQANRLMRVIIISDLRFCMKQRRRSINIAIRSQHDSYRTDCVAWKRSKSSTVKWR